MFKKTSTENEYSASQDTSADKMCPDAGKYHALFMASRDAVMTLDPPSWRFTSANPATLTMFKAKSEKEFLSYEPWRLSPELQPDGRRSDEKAKEMIDAAMREGSNLFEWTHKRLSGEDFSAEVLLSRVGYTDQVFLHAVVRDITERKDMENKLKEAGEERFKAIFNNSNDGILLADAKTTKFYLANRAICQMLGYSNEEIKNLSVSDIHPKESLEHVLDQFQKQLKGKIIVAKDLPVKRKDGSIFYADINSSRVVLEGKEYLLGIFRDITENKKIENELRASEERFRKIFENGQYGIVLTGADSKFIKVNPAFCKITGFTEAELLTKKFSDITHPENVKQDTESVPKLIRGEIPSYNAEKRYIKKDGSEVWVSLLISVIRNIDGSFQYFLGMVEDVSERKKVELELNSKYKELEKMNKLMVGRELKMIELKKEIKEFKK